MTRPAITGNSRRTSTPAERNSVTGTHAISIKERAAPIIFHLKTENTIDDIQRIRTHRPYIPLFKSESKDINPFAFDNKLSIESDDKGSIPECDLVYSLRFTKWLITKLYIA
ncbi:hypothetical protein ECV0102_08030 [Enterobacter cloacae]|nr:hypothetical protein ECV0102_08030 [Enterobacter cloacae]